MTGIMMSHMSTAVALGPGDPDITASMTIGNGFGNLYVLQSRESYAVYSGSRIVNYNSYRVDIQY